MISEWNRRMEIKAAREEEEAKDRETIEEQIMKSLKSIDDETITKIISETLMNDIIEDQFQVQIEKKVTALETIIEAES